MNKITAVNILIIFILIYTAIGSQQDLILSGSVSLSTELSQFKYGMGDRSQKLYRSALKFNAPGSGLPAKKQN